MIKRIALLTLALVLASFSVFAQTPSVITAYVPTVTNLQITQVGVLGTSQACYWVVAIYAGGKSAPYGPACNLTTNGTLSSTSYNVVNFTAPTGTLSAPTGYDILKTATQTPPTGACACSVANNQASSPVNDQATATGAYSVATLSVQVLVTADAISTTSPTVKYTVVNNGTAGAAFVTPNFKSFIFGPFAAASAQNFSAPIDGAYKITGITSVEAVQAGAACTFIVERLTGTTAPASGTNQMTAAFNLQTQAINTVTAGTLVASPATFAAGDRLGIVQTGACTTLANAYITVQMQQLN